MRKQLFALIVLSATWGALSAQAPGPDPLSLVRTAVNDIYVAPLGLHASISIRALPFPSDRSPDQFEVEILQGADACSVGPPVPIASVGLRLREGRITSMYAEGSLVTASPPVPASTSEARIQDALRVISRLSGWADSTEQPYRSGTPPQRAFQFQRVSPGEGGLAVFNTSTGLPVMVGIP